MRGAAYEAEGGSIAPTCTGSLAFVLATGETCQSVACGERWEWGTQGRALLEPGEAPSGRRPGGLPFLSFPVDTEAEDGNGAAVSVEGRVCHVLVVDGDEDPLELGLVIRLEQDFRRIVELLRLRR